ncbi:DNA-binding barrel domain superfamily [Sesbania bispinosa]|nr:DNA-binding barrel domain superfamily [Sesbania bispinosa]
MTNAAEKNLDFFKVFLPERHSEGMFIPKVKLKLFEEKVIKVVILRNRSGRIWHVKVRPINGNVGSCSFTKVDPQLEEDYETDEEIYVQPNNPYFVAKLVKSRPNELHIPKNIIKDFSLSFPKRIAVLCCKCKNLKPHSSQNIQRNEVEAYHLNLPAPQTPIPKKYRRGQVSTWKDGRVCINGWADFCEKYKIEETDVCICEIVMRQHNMVEMLRVHVRRSIKE